MCYSRSPRATPLTAELWPVTAEDNDLSHSRSLRNASLACRQAIRVIIIMFIFLQAVKYHIDIAMIQFQCVGIPREGCQKVGWYRSFLLVPFPTFDNGNANNCVPNRTKLNCTAQLRHFFNKWCLL